MCWSAGCAKRSIGRSSRNCCTRCGALGMSSGRNAFGLRIALWYATLFVGGAVAIVFLTYYLLSVSLVQRDQQLIRAKLGDYAAAYVRAGARGLAAVVPSQQAVTPERLFVRVVDRGVESLVLSNPEGWGDRKSKRLNYSH